MVLTHEIWVRFPVGELKAPDFAVWWNLFAYPPPPTHTLAVSFCLLFLQGVAMSTLADTPFRSFVKTINANIFRLPFEL